MYNINRTTSLIDLKKLNALTIQAIPPERVSVTIIISCYVHASRCFCSTWTSACSSYDHEQPAYNRTASWSL